MATSTTFVFLKGDGTPLAGGTVEVYSAGTNTPKTSYSDSGLSVPNAWPVVLDSNGKADIWISGAYKLIIKDSEGVVQETKDNLWGLGSVTLNFVDGEVGVALTISSATDMLNGGDYLAYSSGGTFAAKLPASPLAGYRLTVHNYGTVAITIDNNGEKINGVLASMSLAAGECYGFKYADSAIDSATGWVARKMATVDGSGGGSGSEQPFVRKTGTTNVLTSNQRIILDASSADCYAQLPSSPADGVWCEVTAEGANAAKIQRGGADTIDTTQTELDVYPNTAMLLVYNATANNWIPQTRV